MAMALFHKLRVFSSVKSKRKKKNLLHSQNLHNEAAFQWKPPPRKITWGYFTKQQLISGTKVPVSMGLIKIYSKAGALMKAKEVFDDLSIRDMVTWTALISEYAQHGYGEEALTCFERMKCESFLPNLVTFICILKACGIIQDIDKGKRIHAKAIMDSSIQKNHVVLTAFVDMYAKCGMLQKAFRVSDQISVKDIVSWTVLIHGFAQHDHGDEALSLFEQMQQEGHAPDIFTISCILKACGSIGCIQKGKTFDATIVEGGSLMKDCLFDTALMDMYAKCGELVKAKEILYTLRSRNVVSWTALLSGYVQHRQYEEALNSYELMQQDGFSPNSVTFLCILKACGSIGAIDKGKEIHKEIMRQRLLEKDALLGNALVDMYAKCGAIAKAREVFNKVPIRDMVSWNAIITGYAQHGYFEEALNCFEKMQHDGLFPNSITFASILKACGRLGAIDKGKLIHFHIVRERLLEKDIIIGNALLDMYVKCGLLMRAQEVFDKLPARNVASWTILITGYSHLEREEVVVNLFSKMLEEGISPNIVTFTAVLNACSHFGLLDKGQMYFDAMSEQYGIIPTLEHHTCMVDLFSRAGHFAKAVSVIKKIPNSDYLPMWTTLLGGCGKWGNLKLGRFAFEHAVQLDPKDAATYISMSNMYVAAAMLEDAQKIEAMRVQNEAYV